MSGEDNYYGITTLYQPPDPDEASFDLVAVHGLKGHAIKTWTHKPSQVMWLRDLLPKGLPNARIMTYGYNARFVNFTAHHDLRHISMKLLSELVDLRKSDKEMARPLIFICHSLGGIVAKKALLIGCSDGQAKVQNATCGIVFMATPHCGSSLANLGKILSDIAAACTPIAAPRNLLSSLQKDSKVLFEITADFVSKVPKLRIVSFYEMELTSIGFFKRLVVEQTSAILNVPDEIVVGQYADHRGISRFSSVDDPNYRPVISRLLQMCKETAKPSSAKVKVEVGVEHILSTDTKSDITHDAPFLVPFAQCVSFHGRQSLIADMEKYFWDSHDSEQLIFAISGLGGCGKTQAALRYAFHARFRYKSGVVFFDASSTSTLIADFHRVHDFLNLGSVSNKIESLKQWFSNQKNQDWLMIFDNADDLTSVPLKKYFPASSWGHIIITGRDQSMIGQLAHVGEPLKPLDEANAMSVLFAKTAAPSSPANIKEAKAIVNLLGCLPLAIDQAGAFIRRRGKSFPDYRRLLESKMHKVLSATPAMQDYEKSVVSVWELNFQQLEQDSRQAWQLLLLLAHLETKGIPERLLVKGTAPKKIWGADGEVTDLLPEDAGIDEELIELLQDEMLLDDAVEHLTAFSLVQRNTTGGRTALSVHTLVQHCVVHRISEEQRKKWQAQAILVVAQAFPFSVYLDQDFGNTGREFMSNVFCVVKEFDAVDRTLPEYSLLQESMKRLLVSTTKFQYTSWKREGVRQIRDILKTNSDPCTEAWVASRESTLLRLGGKSAESYAILEDHLSKTALHTDQTPDARHNAEQGLLVLSFAENLMKDNDLPRARLELEGWRPLDEETPSSMELIVVQSRAVTLARILKSQGCFEEALALLEKLFNGLTDDEYLVSTGWQMVMFSNLADLYCEVGRPKEAEAALEAELKVIFAHGWENISTGRRLQLSLVESFIRRGMFEIAESCLTRLVPQYASLTEPDMIQGTGHFMTLVGLARVLHLQSRWDEALAHWKQASDLIEKFDWPKGFNYGLVLYSMAQVLYQTGDLDGSKDTLEKAKASLETENRKYWIVGLGTYWYDYVVTELGHTGPNPVVEGAGERAPERPGTLVSQLFKSDFMEKLMIS